MAHIAGNWVFQHRRIIPTPKEFSRFAINKAIGHTFVIPKRRHRAARDLFTFLHRRQDRLGHTCCGAWQWFPLQFGQRCDTRNFFYQIRFAQHIWAPAWNMGHVPIQFETQCG